MRKISFQYQTAALALTSSLCLGAGVAHSQEADFDEAGNVEVQDKIVVTAQRREQTLLEVPLAVSVVQGDLLESVFANDIADIQRLVPSVTVANTGDGGPADSRIQIRGVGTNVFSGTVEPSVSFVIDGVPLPRNEAGIVDFVDIERVEVLKGPQGTLFGKNASAGVISYTTRAPSETLEGLIKARGTTDGDYRLDGTVSNGIGENSAFRLTASYNEIADYQTNVFTGEEAGGSKSVGIRGKYVYEADNGFSLGLTGDYFDQESNCCSLAITEFAGANLPLLAAGITASDENTDFSADTIPFNTNTTWGVAAEANWELGAISFTSLTSYRDWDYGGDLQDIDFFGTTNSAAAVGGTGLQQRGFQEAQTITQEFRITPINPDRLNYVAGLFYYQNDYSRFFDRDIQLCFAPAAPAGAPCLAPFAVNQFFTLNVDTTNFAAFGDASYKLTDNFSILGGLRILRDELEFDTETFNGTAGSDRLKDTAALGRIGVQYNWTDDLTSYATYSQGYKSGAFDVTLGVTAAILQGGPIEPETSDAFEFGLRGSLPGLEELFFDLSVFYNSYQDFQVQAFDPDAGGTTRLINAGETVTQGVEFSGLWRPTDAFSVSGSISYLDATYEDFRGNACYFGQTQAEGCQTSPGGVRFQDVSGRTLANAPDWKLSVVPRYEHEATSGATYFAQGFASYQSEVQFSSNQDPDTVFDGYTLVDFSAGYISPDDTYTFTLFMKNAFDEFYPGVLVRNFINDPGGISQIVPRGAQRYGGAELAIRF